MSDTIGPNVKRLLAHRMAVDAVPSGGGLADAIDFLLDDEKRRCIGQTSLQWVKDAIAAMKAAPDNPYGTDDEGIASGLLQEIEKRQREQLKQLSS